jgi:hypothetical protein
MAPIGIRRQCLVPGKSNSQSERLGHRPNRALQLTIEPKAPRYFAATLENHFRQPKQIAAVTIALTRPLWPVPELSLEKKGLMPASQRLLTTHLLSAG